jgi:hypothetical protein
VQQEVRKVKALLSKKVDAGILPLVLTMSIIIAMVCASLITVAYYYRVQNLKTDLRQRLSRNCQSALNYLLAQPDNFPPATQVMLDLYQQSNDSVAITRKQWGVYDVAIIQAFTGFHVSRKAAMLGVRLSPSSRFALYLCDEQKPLTIAGDTRLRGDCFLPKAGVKTTYINKIGYSGDQLVYGNISESNLMLPELNAELVNNLKSLIIAPFSSPGYMLRQEDFLADSMSHSFFEPETYYFHSYEPILIKNALRGNIIIHSDTRVVIDSWAALEDVLVIAPYIHVRNGFKGKMQAFASDTIIVESGCEFDYPSALGVVSEKENGFLHLDHRIKFNGLIFMEGSMDYHNRLLNIPESTVITGQVYANSMVDHKGQVWGSMACKMFRFKTPSINEENYLFHAVVDHTKLPSAYLGSVLLSQNGKREVLKWLY